MIWCRTPFLYGTVVSIVALLSRPVVAGNLDTFYLGNDAAMLGGAVTATATSGSASWYNPAGVGASGYSNIEVNASAYLLRFGGTSDLEGTPGVPASKRKLSSLDVNAVPTALSVKRRILGLDVALGVFVPIRTVSYPRTSIQVRPANRPPEALTLDGNLRTTDYYAGFSVGRALQPNLRQHLRFFCYQLDV